MTGENYGPFPERLDGLFLKLADCEPGRKEPSVLSFNIFLSLGVVRFDEFLKCLVVNCTEVEVD